MALGMSAEFEKPVDVSRLPFDIIANRGIPLIGDNVEYLEAGAADTQDYILASDYVITKAGWGTVAGCLLARKKMALFRRETVLEDRTTIRILEEQKLAVSISECDLEHIDAVVERMDRAGIGVDMQKQGTINREDMLELTRRMTLSRTDLKADSCFRHLRTAAATVTGLNYSVPVEISGKLQRFLNSSETA